MRKFALFASLVAWSFLFGKEDEPIDFSLLETREINGERIYFLKDKNEPFTGKSLSVSINGQKEAEINYKDGKPNGLITFWHENGQLKQEGNLMDGIQHGITIYYDKNGKEIVKQNWQYGELVFEKKAE